MNAQLLSRYIGIFGNLHRNQNPKKGYAPHKPILLLALLDETERGNIKENLVPITPELVATFRAYWRALVPPDTWIERMVYPFRYLIQDGFWELVKNGVPQSPRELGDPTSLNQLSALIDGGRFAPDLWQLLQDKAAINALRTYLLKEYFGVGIADVQPQIPANPIDYEIERLKSEAQSVFRAKKINESKDETGYYVRHSLFPKVVKALYNEACSVCRLTVRTDDGSGLVDAAHIMPFGIFHNDDPRNGLAFCKNHHWGFDAGWFTITDEYRIVVSPHLQTSHIYVMAGSPLALPTDIECAPAPAALAWHRSNIYKK